MSKLVHSAHKEKKRSREATISATSSSDSSKTKKKITKTTTTDIQVELEKGAKDVEENIDSLEKFEAELNIKVKKTKGNDKPKGKEKGKRNEGKGRGGGGGGGGKGEKQPTSSSVIYLGHIAHGFYEKQMKEFFVQFGEVKRLKLFRSKKTGKSKGYAFIEFLTPEIAQTVSEAMHGYFLHERQLVCHVVPPEKLHEGMFIYHKITTRMTTDTVNPGDDHDDEKEEQDDDMPDFVRNEKQMMRMKASHTKKIKELKAKGIDFDVLESLV